MFTDPEDDDHHYKFVVTQIFGKNCHEDDEFNTESEARI
eukprot:SAG11_NODE_31567_length_290_cov_15.073298_1_plen_38_part_10